MTNKRIYNEEVIINERKEIPITERPSSLKIFIKTFGCQMNEKDSERIYGMIKDSRRALSPDEADVIILNTCAVREKPEQKIYSELGKYLKLKKSKRDIKIGVVGCVAQLKGSEILQKVDVDFVLGTSALHKINKVIEDTFKNKVVVDTSIELNIKDRFESPIYQEFYNGSRVKAYVTIQEGCNQFCTFCIVPITRGREITRPSIDIIQEVKEFISKGVKEITLIGQNVNGYGWNTPGEMSFADLLRTLNKIDGLLRIRFTTSNPRYVNDDMIQAMKECEKVCEHLHLPVQSGSNRILKKMARRYTIEEYYNIIEKIRKFIPSCSITTDIIVGFPGETDKDFEETLNMVKTIKFDDIFSFKYSIRPGTAAERFPDQIPEDVKAHRLKILQETQDRITKEIMQSYVSRVEEILVEGPAERNGEKDSTGRTRTNKVVNFEGKPQIGSLIKVKITEAYRNSLRGEIVV